mmetsp:Transcript_13519/g.39471  ORF Transcript_13519/g.39471 Transcript_13519/m.39471 type:complete len:201 (-) Transcript_13519:55-657(-)
MGASTSCCSGPAQIREELDEAFVVYLQREQGKIIGLDLDVTDGRTARVLEVLPQGTAYSSGAKVQAGDHIVAVNGAKDSIGITKRLQQDDQLELLVHRPKEFRISITKAEEGLGIEFTHATNGNSLLIRGILKKGAIQEWNATHESSLVRNDDRIVEVNGVRGGWEKLLEAMKKESHLKLVIAPAPALLPSAAADASTAS